MLRRDIQLEPVHLGRNLLTKVKDRVTYEVEGICLGKLGYVIHIINLYDEDISCGLIDNDSGAVNISVRFRAIVFRPFEHEVVDAVVTTASDETGFFANVGPLSIFVSRHCMSEDIHFDYVRGDTWASEDGEVEIREGTVVRLRILGLTIGAHSMDAVGTIKDDFLGMLHSATIM